VVINRCDGYLVSQISSCLSNMHISERRIYLTRHGQSEYNVLKRLGGDSGLTARGRRYSAWLNEFVRARQASGTARDLLVLTSALVRTVQTAEPLRARGVKTFQTSVLNEINAGPCEGLTYEEVAEAFPEEFAARARDKLRYRYPGGGESYKDVMIRLRPVVIELERQRRDCLIVGHHHCRVGHRCGHDDQGSVGGGRSHRRGPGARSHRAGGFERGGHPDRHLRVGAE